MVTSSLLPFVVVVFLGQGLSGQERTHTTDRLPLPDERWRAITTQAEFAIVPSAGRMKLIKDGEDWLMFGVYWTMLCADIGRRTKRIQDVRSSNGIFNCIQSPVDRDDGPFFDVCARNGLYVFLQNNDANWNDAQTVTYFREKVAFGFHSPFDDVDTTGIPPSDVQARIELVENAHPRITHLTGSPSKDTRPPYIGLGEEVNSSQSYPYNSDPESASYFSFQKARCNDDADGNTTLLVADLQAYDAGHGFPPALNCRTQLWSAVANGVRGFLWYALDDGSGYDWFAQSDTVTEISLLGRELQSIRHEISNGALTVESNTGDAELFISTLDTGDPTGILIVMNLRENPGDVDVDLTLASGATGTGLLPRTFPDDRYGNGLQLDGSGRLTGLVERLSVHVYDVMTP